MCFGVTYLGLVVSIGFVQTLTHSGGVMSFVVGNFAESAMSARDYPTSAGSKKGALRRLWLGPLCKTPVGRGGVIGMLGKAQSDGQTPVWSGAATPTNARNDPPRRVCEITGRLGRCAARLSGIQPDLRDAPSIRPVLSQTRPTGVLQRVPSVVS